MDGIKAKELAQQLEGKVFAGFQVIKLLNNGKSAAVFRAQDTSGKLCALKIFDSELVEKYGAAIQIDRIQREVGLKGHGIEGLINILDGGPTMFEGKEQHFIVMELIEGHNLLQYYTSKKYEVSFVRKVLDTLYRVSELLLTTFNIAHRDIKPENVMVTTDGRIILMDLGVLKILDSVPETDLTKKEFLGTLQYAPPEFITRHEENTPEGWRAINLYQIGGVLHDLLLKKQLFEGVSPYGELINLIFNQPPPLSAADYPFALVQLTRDMLAKDWRTRLRLCTTEKIAAAILPTEVEGNLDSELDNIFSQADKTIQLSEEVERRLRTAEQKEQQKREISQKLRQVVSQSIAELRDRKLITQFSELPVNFPIHHRMRTNIGGVPTLNAIYEDDARDGESDISMVYMLHGEAKLGYFLPVYLLVRLRNDEESNCTVSMGAISRNHQPAALMTEPYGYFLYLAQQFGLANPHAMASKVLYLQLLDLFKGTVEFGGPFQTHLTIQIARLLKLYLKAMLPYSERELSGELIDKHDFKPVMINQWE
jgi:eukaryotic-like serine/threonine-protein kinase